MTPEDAFIPGVAASGRSAMTGLNAGAIVVAALYFGREVLEPLVLASLLAFVLAPACALLGRARLPRVIAVLLVVVLAFAVLGGIGTMVGRQVAMLTANLPSYMTTIEGKWHALIAGGGLLGRAEALVPAGSHSSPAFGAGDESRVALARSWAQPLLGPLGTAGIVLVFTIFILLANEDLRDRLVRLVGRRDLHRTILAMSDAARRLSRYFLFQLGLNTGFGVGIGIGLWLVGLPNSVLWGILAGLMRFVPYVGVFIALAPPLLLALAVAPGWSLALVVLVLFIGGELVMGQIIEPLIYGHSTGLSPLAIIVATAFWTLLWGPIGLLLATPLTVCLVVIGRHVQPLAFLEVVLGDTPPLLPPETFYQRALEAKGRILLEGARRQIAVSSRADYYDVVALRGLILVQADLSRDALAFERLEAIHEQIAGVLARLDNGAEPTVVTRNVAWREGDPILCIPGRGQLDDLAATMAVQALRASGLGSRVEPNLVLGASGPSSIGLARVRLCCLSVIEEGSTASGIQYFIRRIRKTMPDATVVVCLWHARSDSQLLATLRSTGQEEQIVLSIGELIALAQVLATREQQSA